MSNTVPIHEDLVTTRGAADVQIRAASSGDVDALRRLAQLDSSRLPHGPIVVAEVADQLRAAYSITEGRAIADPFHRTKELVALLELRAGQLDGEGRRGRGSRRSPAPQPPGFGLAFLPRRIYRRAT